MQLRYVKDFAITLIVIIFLVLGIRLYTNYFKAKDVPQQSIHSKESVSDTLLSKIKGIEKSIQDRKTFVFSINRDPLRQGNIIKDRLDLEREFVDNLRNTFRLSSTSITENGNKIATIEYRDQNYYASIGDVVEGRRITEIGTDWIRYYFNGSTYTTQVAPRPPMPDFSTINPSELQSGNF